MTHTIRIGDTDTNRYEVLSYTDKKLLRLLNRSDFICCKITLYGKIFINDNIIEDIFYFFIDKDKTNQDFKDFKNNILARASMYEKCFMEINYTLKKEDDKCQNHK